MTKNVRVYLPSYAILILLCWYSLKDKFEFWFLKK